MQQRYKFKDNFNLCEYLKRSFQFLQKMQYKLISFQANFMKTNLSEGIEITFVSYSEEERRAAYGRMEMSHQ